MQGYTTHATPYSHNWRCPGTGDRLILGVKRLHHRPAHFNAPVGDEGLGGGVWVGWDNPAHVNNISRCMGWGWGNKIIAAER